MSKCPICKEDNHCAVSRGEDPNTCWCMKVTIPKELLEKSSSDKGSCICLKCINHFGITAN